MSKNASARSEKLISKRCRKCAIVNNAAGIGLMTDTGCVIVCSVGHRRPIDGLLRSGGQ